MAGPFLYWRIYSTANNNAWPAIQISEVQWRVIAGGAKTNPVAITGDKTFSTNVPSNVNDGNFATNWVTDGSIPGIPAGLYFQFGTAVSFAELAIAPIEGAGNNTYAPKNFTVDGSPDNITWTNVTTYSGIPAASYTPDTFTTFNLNAVAAGLQASQLSAFAVGSNPAAAGLRVSQLFSIAVIANGQSFQQLNPAIKLSCWTPCGTLLWNGV